MPHLASALLSGAILSLSIVPGPAVAAGPKDVSMLALSVTSDRVSTAGGAISAYRAVILSCDPPGGFHPRAAEACAQLDRSAGKIEIPSAGAFCTKEYAPVTVDATGHWKGKLVRFQRTYGNACEVRSATGVLFDF